MAFLRTRSVSSSIVGNVNSQSMTRLLPVARHQLQRSGAPLPPVVVVPAQAGTQYTPASTIEPQRCGVLDSRLRGNDGGGGTLHGFPAMFRRHAPSVLYQSAALTFFAASGETQPVHSASLFLRKYFAPSSPLA